jgi:ribose 1,5-bisphosphokinase
MESLVTARRKGESIAIPSPLHPMPVQTGARLVYLIGPSGAGKDSVLDWLRERLPPGLPLHWARRTITRSAQAGAEAHESVTEAEFDALQQQDEFALEWHASRLRYGIRKRELEPLQRGGWVLLNGSRAYQEQCRLRFPGMTVVHISASPEQLRRRLLARGREDARQVEERIARAAAFDLPAGAHEIRNDGTLEQAGHALWRILAQLGALATVPDPRWVLAKPASQD